MDVAAKRALWIDAFKQDWQGDLFLLPFVELRVEDLAHVKSIGMYHRLCELFTGGWTRHIPLQKMWLDAVPLREMAKLGAMAVEGNCVDFLKHLFYEELVTIEEIEEHEECHVFDMQDSILNLAAGHGRLEMVEYLLSLPEVSCTPHAMDLAASSGNLDLVIWFHTNRREGCTDNAMDFAAKYGHLPVVQWLHANRREGCTTDAIDWAAENGHRHVVEWLLANRTEGFTAKAIINAETDEIAAVMTKTLTFARRNILTQEIVETGNKAAVKRILSRSK